MVPNAGMMSLLSFRGPQVGQFHTQLLIDQTSVLFEFFSDVTAFMSDKWLTGKELNKICISQNTRDYPCGNKNSAAPKHRAA
jgi:hypothetical protein